MSALRSRKYLDGSKGASCKLRIPGVCNNDPATVVACHIKDGNRGYAIKASDLSVVDGCFNCHRVFDSQAPLPDGSHLTDKEWLFYALRGLQETLEARLALGLLIVPADTPKPFHDRPVKPRKPKEQRVKLQSRSSFAK